MNRSLSTRWFRKLVDIRPFWARYYVSVFAFHKCRRGDPHFWVLNQFSLQFVAAWMGVLSATLVLLDLTSVWDANASAEIFLSPVFPILLLLLSGASFLALFGWRESRERLVEDGSLRGQIWSGWNLLAIDLAWFIFGGALFIAFVVSLD